MRIKDIENKLKEARTKKEKKPVLNFHNGLAKYIKRDEEEDIVGASLVKGDNDNWETIIPFEAGYKNFAWSPTNKDNSKIGFVDGVDNWQWGLLDLTSGKVLFKPKFDRIADIDGGIGVAIHNERYLIFDTNDGEVISPPFYDMSRVSEQHGVAIVGNENNKFGIYNLKSKKMVTPFLFDSFSGYIGDYGSGKMQAPATIENKGVRDGKYTVVNVFIDGGSFQAKIDGEKVSYIKQSDGSYKSANGDIVK